MANINCYLELNSSYKNLYKGNNKQIGKNAEVSDEQLFYNITTDVDIVLNCLNISAGRGGYRYWKDAVFIYITSSNFLVRVCKDIYPVIGMKYGKTGSSVERAMRSCFEDVMYQSSKKGKNFVTEYLKNYLLFPRNSELLLRIVELVVSKEFQEEKHNLILSM